MVIALARHPRQRTAISSASSLITGRTPAQMGQGASVTASSRHRRSRTAPANLVDFPRREDANLSITVMSARWNEWSPHCLHGLAVGLDKEHAPRIVWLAQPRAAGAPRSGDSWSRRQIDCLVSQLVHRSLSNDLQRHTLWRPATFFRLGAGEVSLETPRRIRVAQFLHLAERACRDRADFLSAQKRRGYPAVSVAPGIDIASRLSCEGERALGFLCPSPGGESAHR